MKRTRQSAWRFGVPVVCLLAGLLLAATHGVSGGGEIRRSDAPRLVDLVREAQQSVDRLSAQRDSLGTRLDTHHGGSPGADAALAAITKPNRQAGRRRRPGPDARAGSGGHPQRRPARRQRPLPPRRLPRRPRRAPAGHPGGAERTVECGRRGHPDAGPADHRHLGAAVRGQHAAAQRTHLQPAVRRSPRSATPPPCRPPWRRRRWSRSTSSTWCGSGWGTPRNPARRWIWSGTPSRCGCASPSPRDRSVTSDFGVTGSAERDESRRDRCGNLG